MKKSNRSKAKSPKSIKPKASKPKVKPEAKPIPADPNNPYRPTSTYGVLFREGQDYIAKSDLIKKVADLTRKSEKVIGYSYDVLRSRHHKSNGGRSVLLVDEATGKVKFVALKPLPTI